MNLTFFPMHLLGTTGMARRIADYSATAGWNDLNLLATIGGFTIAVAMLPFLWNVFASLRGGPSGRRRPVGGQHPRVGDLVAAAALQLRPPAADPVGAPGLRPAPRRRRGPADGGALTMAVQPSAVAAARAGSPRPHAHAQRGISNPILGMILFIASEVMFFAGLFAAYFNVRLTSPHWPPLVNEQPSTSRSTSTRRSTSSWPAIADRDPRPQLGHDAAGRVGDPARRPDGVPAGHRRSRSSSASIFLGGQVWDYTQLGFGITDTAFGSTFYTLTGFHGAHVLGGAIMLLGRPLPRPRRAVLRPPPRRGRGDVALLALRRRRLDRPLLHALPAVAPGGSR